MDKTIFQILQETDQSDVTLRFRRPEQEDGIIYECRTIKCTTK